MIFLALPSQCWDHSFVPPHLALFETFKINFLSDEYVCVCVLGTAPMCRCYRYSPQEQQVLSNSGPSLQPILETLKMFKSYYSVGVSNGEFEHRWHSVLVEVRGQLPGVGSPTRVPQITVSTEGRIQ